MNRLVVVLLFALIAGACEREVDRFSPLVAVAAKDWDGILFEFGSPRALPRLSEDGWSHGETAEDGNTFRWASSEQAAFTLPSPTEAKRILWLECEPFLFEGGPTQWISIAVNGEPLTEVELRPGRERYPIEVPFIAGDNVFDLRFRFAGDPNRTSADRRKLAVAFYQASVLPEDEAPVAGAPSPFSWQGDDVVLPEGGSMSVFSDLAGEATLVVSPTRRSRDEARLTVSVRTMEGVLVDEAVSLDESSQWKIAHEGPVEISIGAENDAVAVHVELLTSADPPESPPVEPVDANVVLIFLDGANALRTGLYGYDKNTTPNLDALGAESLVFENAVSQAVYTIASMGSVLTGQYPERHQSVTFADKLRDDVVTLPGVVSQHGFRTAGFSGNSVASRTFGLDQGYETFVPVWEDKDYTGH